jgi:CRP/FNR family transcriptional regulator
MNSPNQPKPSKIGSGRNILNKTERYFKKGSVMFLEGDTSTEMYIIRSGMVRVIRQEGERVVELAVLGPGSVLGELALLDHQPRSATAQIVDDVVATVVDEKQLQSTLTSIPNWLANIVQLVVKRLRDTMRRTTDDIVKKSIGGVLRILLLVYKQEGRPVAGETSIPSTLVKKTIRTTIGIGDIEAEKVFMHLIMKRLMVIRKRDGGDEYLVMKNLDAAELYVQYLRARQRGEKLAGEDLPAAAARLVSCTLAAGDKLGKVIKDGIVRVGLKAVEEELTRKGLTLDMEMLALLAKARLVHEEHDGGEAGFKNAVLLFNRDTLRRVEFLHQWLPIFEEDVGL